MESVYWVLTWVCHRRCVHCYDDRFRPYVRAGLRAVMDESEAAWRKVLANLPPRFHVRDPARTGPLPDGRRIGRIILAGGELLHKPVYQPLFLPVLEALQARYGPADAKISVQTTGDLLTADNLRAMLERGVHTIAISGMDDYHVGMEGERRVPLMEHVRGLMAQAGVEEVTLGGRGRDYTQEDGPFFLFFGAQPGSWIGEIWPRGRAWTHNLTGPGAANADGTPGLGPNFCARQSGGKNFLNYRSAGSEVAIEPDGSVYPCCLKTRAPLGNLTRERLTDILDDLAGEPAMQAINAGDPAAMGEAFGHTRASFEADSHTARPDGAPYANLCIGCDAFFERTLGAVLARREARRLSVAAQA
jgi:hypothetical protein